MSRRPIRATWRSASTSRKHQTTRTIQIGDMLDYHAISFHASEPDAAAGDEAELARKRLPGGIRLG